MSNTVFKINFDYTIADQRVILDQLQENGYKLLGYKGATGPNQVTTGLPVWFTEDFIDQFGKVEIDYEPLYKVYVFNEHELAANTIIQMQVMSDLIGLGTALTFNADGTFSPSSENVAPAGTITVINNRPAGTNNVTIGLAAKVNGEYKPFCAFTATPQGSVSMSPLETVCLFAAKTDLVSGSVTGNAVSPGCSFEFSPSYISYDLLMQASTYGITSAPGALAVQTVNSGASLTELLNGGK